MATVTFAQGDDPEVTFAGRVEEAPELGGVYLYGWTIEPMFIYSGQVLTIRRWNTQRRVCGIADCYGPATQSGQVAAEYATDIEGVPMLHSETRVFCEEHAPTRAEELFESEWWEPGPDDDPDPPLPEGSSCEHCGRAVRLSVDEDGRPVLLDGTGFMEDWCPSAQSSINARTHSVRGWKLPKEV